MSPNRTRYPQTHVQTIGPLMLQLHDQGFDAADLERVDRVYHLAARLWAVNFQSTMRPFVCHLVGTASHVAEHGGDLDTVLAALLHAAYSSGDFGVRIGGVTRRKRAIVEETAGVKAESLVLSFYGLLSRYGLHWDRALENGGAELTEADKTAMFIRVCNDLDDVSELAFCGPERRLRIDNFCSGSLKLARFIGRDDLADLLERRMQEYRALEFLPDTVTGQHAGGHIVLPPAFRKRLVPGILEVLHRWRSTGSPFYRG